MYKTVILCFLEDCHRFVIGDIVSATCLTQVIRHVAYTDAPVAVVVRAAFVQFLATVTARADAHTDMSFVFLEPVADMFDIHTLVLHRDSFLYRNDVHSYTAASHRHHRRDLLKRQECHALEEHRQLRMTVHQFGIHVGIFGTTGNEHRHPVYSVFAVECRAFVRSLTVGVMVAVVVLQHTEIRQLVQQLVKRLIVRRVVLLGVHLMQLRVRVMLAYLKEITGQHVQQQIQRRFSCHSVHLVLKDTSQTPILGGIGGHLDLTGNTVRDVTDELQQLWIRILVSFMLGDKLF